MSLSVVNSRKAPLAGILEESDRNRPRRKPGRPLGFPHQSPGTCTCTRWAIKCFGHYLPRGIHSNYCLSSCLGTQASHVVYFPGVHAGPIRTTGRCTCILAMAPGGRVYSRTVRGAIRGAAIHAESAAGARIPGGRGRSARSGKPVDRAFGRSGKGTRAARRRRIRGRAARRPGRGRRAFRVGAAVRLARRRAGAAAPAR